MTAKIHVERMMHRNSIAVSGESAASYALIKLIPSGLGSPKAMPLNLALVLDVPVAAFSTAYGSALAGWLTDLDLERHDARQV